MIDRNSSASNDSRIAAEESQQAAIDGKRIITDMVEAIGEINSSNLMITNEITESNTRINDIVKLIRDIGEKTQVINEIVFQTKLLSFNASVEAARAGEHGKGFSVVAEEVVNLAHMSGSAAEEISRMLDESIKTVEEIVKNTSGKVESLVATGNETIQKGERLASSCGDALDRIVENVLKVNIQVTDIANASKEQSQGVQEINSAMKQLDEVTNLNNQVSNETNKQADKLEEQSQALFKEVVKLLKIVKGNEDSAS